MKVSQILLASSLVVTLNQVDVQAFTSHLQQKRSVHNSFGAVAINGESSTSTTENEGNNSEGIDWVDSIRLNIFEKAKTVASVCTSGTLCTVSGHDGIQGAPFGSFVDYVLDDEGNPVLLMNEMSMHTINIDKNALNGNNGGQSLVTLFTQLASETGGSKFGQDVSRCSLTCKVEKVADNAPDMDLLRMRYSLTHAYADQVMDSPKFSFYRLLPETIYFVGGFGVLAKWVDVAEYKAASPDILAAEAAQIVSKINREFQDDLELTAKHILEVEGLEEVRVTSIDRLGMDMRVTRFQGARRNKRVTDEYRIGFRIPVISIEDAKSEYLKVFQEAWEKANDISWDDDEEPGSDVPVLKIAADSLE